MKKSPAEAAIFNPIGAIFRRRSAMVAERQDGPQRCRVILSSICA
jgi:hypothetical protein